MVPTSLFGDCVNWHGEIRVHLKMRKETVNKERKRKKVLKDFTVWKENSLSMNQQYQFVHRQSV